MYPLPSHPGTSPGCGKHQEVSRPALWSTTLFSQVPGVPRKRHRLQSKRQSEAIPYTTNFAYFLVNACDHTQQVSI